MDFDGFLSKNCTSDFQFEIIPNNLLNISSTENTVFNEPLLFNTSNKSVMESVSYIDKRKEIVQLSDIKFRYSKYAEDTLNHVSLSCSHNETIGILGHNGAGKSTLFRIILGLLKPQSGYVNVHCDHKKIEYMPESNGVYDGLTCYENLRFRYGLQNKNRIERDAKIDDALYQVSLYKAKYKKAGLLSNGMKKRLALACCLINDADLFLLDEPTSGIDPESLDKFCEIMGTLKNKCILIISHDLATIQDVASRYIILQNGSVIYDDNNHKGNLRELYMASLKSEGDEMDHAIN